MEQTKKKEKIKANNGYRGKDDYSTRAAVA